MFGVRLGVEQGLMVYFDNEYEEGIYDQLEGLGLGVKCIDLETGQETQQDPSRSQHEQQAAN